MEHTRPRKRHPTTSDRIDKAQPAYIVVDKFGGLAKFCQVTGWPTSTVHDWLVKGLIPADRQARTLELAALHRVRVKAVDFVPQPKAA
jgi:hypothetical protein